MALNPTFASASVNPSQSIGSDASAPAQGALPTGMPQNTGFSGLGQQPQLGGLDIGYVAPQEPVVPNIANFNQSYYQSPQYQSYLNNMPQYGTDDMSPMPFGGYGSSSIGNYQQQSYDDFLKNPSMGQPATQEFPDYKYVDPNPRINYFNDKNNFGGDLNTQIKAIDDAGQADPQYTEYLKKFYADADSYRNAPFTGEFRDMMPSPPQDYVSYLGQQDLINKQNSMPYQPQDNLFGQPSQSSAQGKAFTQFPDGTPNPIGNYYNAGVEGWYNQPGAPTFEEWQANPSLATEFQNRQAQQPNYALQPPTEFVGQIPQQSLQQDPPSRYTYFGDDKADYSQLGLSQTALDSLKMMSGAQDAGQFYYDTQTKTFNQGAGRPGPNIPGQRQRVGMSNIPLELMNKLGSGEQIDFSPYVQYTEGTPLPPPTLQDLASQTPMPEQQPMPTQRNPLTPTATPTGTTPMATNPLSTYATTPTTGSTPAPTLNATPGSASSGSFGQGGVLPNVTTTQQQVTAAPTFYTDYLNQLATQGGRAAQDAQYVGAQPLQEQAFNLASQNVGNYQPTLQNAINLASSVGNTNLAQAIGDVGQANIARNLSPQATAGIVGSGQFGSKRGAQALGDVIANAQLGLTAQQQQAMQQDMANRIAAAQQLGTLANSTQQLGLGDVNALSTLGQQQQTIAQNQQLFPMQQLANQSALLRGYTIPTSVSASQTGPGQQGQFQTSPLQQIMSVGTLLGALAKPGADGKSAGGNLYSGLDSLIKRLTGGTYTANPSTNTTTSTSIGDVSASMKTLPDGKPNPNYDAYADPNATDADRMAQNLLNSGNPGNVLFDDGSDVNDSNVYDYSNYDPDA